MDSERWKQVEAIYNSAMGLGADDREAFLDVACAGDEGLRLEVLSLLSSAERSDSFLEEPALNIGLALMGSEHESLVGKVVGRYKLLDLLGRGGMGEVYLAHDPTLNRRVALKLLPPAITSDRERVRRFEQEARAASAISHPNVAHIYEIGEAWGQPYITMEYVSGRTLRQAIKRGPMEARAALDIAVQVASALAAAHEVGVIHRDVKPENIMLRDDGYVKVLDFGLAKLVEGRGHLSDPEATPVPSLHTEPELLMGTPDYMSPEQVRREPVDERTDLWSLGVVLYEMSAGRRPFKGRGAGEVIASILEREPEPLGEIRPELPAALAGLVSKALLKRPNERYQTASEMVAELQDARRRLGEGGRSPEQTHGGGTDGAQSARTGSHGPTAEQQVSTAEVRKRNSGILGFSGFPLISGISTRTSVLTKRWRAAHWLILLALVGVGLYLGLPHVRQRRLLDREINLRFERLNLSGAVSDVVLSPDGKYVASVVAEGGKQTVHVTELATAGDLRITPPSEEDGYSGLSFSPDGTYIYYLEKHGGTGRLYRVSKLGGGLRKILDNVNTAVTFSPDGAQMAFVRSKGDPSEPADLIVAQADGSSEQVLAKRARTESDFFLSDMEGAGPAWSPDGKVLACPVRDRSHGRPEINVDIIDTGGGASRRLNGKPWYDVSRVIWLADASGLVVASAELPGAPGQLQLLSYPGGEARKVTNDPNNWGSVSGSRDSGLFLTLNVETNSSVWQLPAADVEQPAASMVSQRNGVSGIEWAGDGRLLYVVSDGTNRNVWAQEKGSAAARQLTFESDNFRPAASPDSRYVVFVSKRAGTTNIWRMDADGTHPVRLTAGAYEDMPSVTPDGRWVVYRTGRDIRRVPLDGGESVKLFDMITTRLALSPDGRLLALFANDRAGGREWHIEEYDLSTAASVKRFGLPEATDPFNDIRWTPEGRGLSYVSNADGAPNVWLQKLDGGPPLQLTHFRDAEILSFAWSPDGKQIACVRSTKAYVPVLVRLF